MDIFEENEYDKNSETQRKQGEFLIELSKDYSPEKVRSILDIGCGDGFLTNKISEEFEDAHTIGIDSASSQLKKAKSKYQDIEFKRRVFPMEVDSSQEFDLIISNCAMHWIDSQVESYNKIRDLLSDNGVFVIHQGHKGCYSEMRSVAKNIIKDLGYEERIDDWNYPIYYHTEKSIYQIVKGCGLEIQHLEVREVDLPNSIYTDYSNAGLGNFKELVSEGEWKNFKEKFIERANKELEVDDICSKRLYFVVSKS